MVVVLLIGTASAGKSVVKNVLVNHGFTEVDVSAFLNYPSLYCSSYRLDRLFHRFTNLSLTYDPFTWIEKYIDFSDYHFNECCNGFSSHSGRERKIKTLEKRLLEYYDKNIVITGLSHLSDIFVLSSRPFTLVVGVDAPLLQRFNRYNSKHGNVDKESKTSSSSSLTTFVHVDHAVISCENLLRSTEKKFNETFCLQLWNDSLGNFVGNCSVYQCLRLADVLIYNSKSVQDLIESVTAQKLDSINVLRPDYDTYFMRLAFETSMRSNCLRRSVGAIITLNNKVIATGYNGTPTNYENCFTGMMNTTQIHCYRTMLSISTLVKGSACFLGGCNRCRDPNIQRGSQLDTCLCVHAEANALLQAGITRCRGGTIYITCFPCLSCAKLILQGEISRIVYFCSYDNNKITLQLLGKYVTFSKVWLKKNINTWEKKRNPILQCQSTTGHLEKYVKAPLQFYNFEFVRFARLWNRFWVRCLSVMNS